MKIAILASGEGTNAKNIVEYLQEKNYEFVVFTNNSNSGVIEKSKNLGIDYYIINSNSLLDHLLLNKVDFVILAGYLKLIPENVIDMFPKKIVNIHPSLLPKFGGRGMWGMNVHRSVIEEKETESGITIHYVSKEYDRGEIIEQHKCEVLLCDTPESLQKKISLLERDNYPKCVESLLKLF